MANRNYKLNPLKISKTEIEGTKDFKKLEKAVRSNSNREITQKKGFSLNTFIFTISALLITVSVILFKGKKEPQKVEQKRESVVEIELVDSTREEKKVSPPILGINVPFSSYKIDNQVGGNLIYKTGSVLEITPNTFLDSLGKTIKGEVEIRYREFHNPFALFLSGIPMEYDSAKSEYVFESAGMVELRAFKDTKEVVMDENKPINIDMVSLNNKDGFNIYTFNEKEGNWEYKKKSECKPYMNLYEPNEKEAEKTIEKKPFPLKRKNSYCFSVDYEKEDFPELNTNVIFEVDQKLSDFDPKYYNVSWEKIQLKKADIPEKYLITLQKGTKVIKLYSYPVLLEEDYLKSKTQFAAEEKERIKSTGKRKYISAINEEITESERNINLLLRQEASSNQGFYKKKVNVRNLLLRATGIVNCDTPIIVFVPDEDQKQVVPSFSEIKEKEINKIYTTIGNRNALFTSRPGLSISYYDNKKMTFWVLLKDGRILVFNDKQFKEAIKQKKFEGEIYETEKGLKILSELLT